MGRAKGWGLKAGRALVVLVLLVVGARGLVGIARGSGDPQTVVRATSGAQQWPDDEARAFAVQFARSYYDYDPKHPGYYEKSLTPYIDTNVVARVVPAWDPAAPQQSAVSAVVAGATTLAKDRGLVTVAVAVREEDRTSTRYLAVPVARDKSGGLTVNAPPSMTSAPLTGEVNTLETDALDAPEASAITETLTRFFKAYLAGDSDAVAAGPALPGAQLGALPVSLQFDGIQSTNLVEPPRGKTREVEAVVSAKEGETSYQLSYRLRLTKGDRWYVAAINEAPK